MKKSLQAHVSTALASKKRASLKGISIVGGPSSDFLDPNNWRPARIISYWIPLSNRYDIHARVSGIDYDWAMQWLWCHTYGSGERIHAAKYQRGFDKIYARRAVGTPWGNRTLWLHRLICHRVQGPPPSHEHVADHLNGDSLDCRRQNLKWATLSENSRNRFGSAWLAPRLFDALEPHPASIRADPPSAL